MWLQRNKAVFKEKKSKMLSDGVNPATDIVFNTSALDYMPAEEFIRQLMSSQVLDYDLRVSCLSAIASELKGLRALQSLSTLFSAKEIPVDMLDRIIQTASNILSAQDTFLVLKYAESQFKCSHSRLEKFNGLELSIYTSELNAKDSFRTALLRKIGERFPYGPITTSLILAPIFVTGALCGFVVSRNKYEMTTPAGDPNVNCVAKMDSESTGRTSISVSAQCSVGTSSADSYDDEPDTCSSKFTSSDEILLGYVASTIGVALCRAAPSPESSQETFTQAAVSTTVTKSSTIGSYIQRKSMRVESSIQNIIEQAYAQTQADRISVFLHNPRTNSLECILSKDILGFNISAASGFAGLTFTSAQMLNITQTSVDSRHLSSIDATTGYQTNNLLCAPIINEEGVSLGVVEAINKKSGQQFSSDDEVCLQNVGKLLSGLVRLPRQLSPSQQDDKLTPATIHEEQVQSEPDTSMLDNETFVGLLTMLGSLSRCATFQQVNEVLSRTISRQLVCKYAELFELVCDDDLGLSRLVSTREESGNSSGQMISSAFLNSLSTRDAVELPTSALLPEEREQFQCNPWPEECDKIVALSFIISIGSTPQASVQLIRQPSSMKAFQRASSMHKLTRRFVIVLADSGNVWDAARRNATTIQEKSIVSVLSDIASGNAEPSSSYLGMFRMIVSHTFEGIVHADDLTVSYSNLQAKFSVVNAALASSTDLVMILDKSGEVIAANKKLESFLRDQQMPTSTRPSASRKLGKKNSIPSIFFGDSMDFKVHQSVHYSKWLEGCSCAPLQHDINAALLSGVPSSMKMVTLLSEAGHFQDLFVDYRIFAIDSNGKMAGPEGGDVSALVVILKIADKSTAFTEIIRRYSHVDNVVDVNDVDTSSGIALVACSLLHSCGTEFTLPVTLHDELRGLTENLSRLAKSIRIIETASHRITSISCKDPHVTEASESWKPADGTEETARRVNIISRQLSLEFPAPENLKSWEFNALDIESKDQLCCCVGRMFAESVDLSSLGVDIGALSAYISMISKHYHNNPFHNFFHAVTVSHMGYMILNTINAASFLAPLKLFSVLLACLVHDVDHPGNTNAFEINCGTELALRYNDQSVLENHHCSTAFRLMRKPGVNILQSFRNAAASDVRKTTVACILGTDMAVHFQMVDELKKFTAAAAQLSSAVVPSRNQLFQEQGNVMLLCRALVHSADLSNPVRTFNLTKRWAELISAEFNAQVAKEEELGLPVLGFMVTRDVKTLCKNELGFASFVISPLWKCLASLLPELNPLVHQLDNNQGEWKRMLDDIERAEEEEDESPK